MDGDRINKEQENDALEFPFVAPGLGFRVCGKKLIDEMLLEFVAHVNRNALVKPQVALNGNRPITRYEKSFGPIIRSASQTHECRQRFVVYHCNPDAVYKRMGSILGAMLLAIGVLHLPAFLTKVSLVMLQEIWCYFGQQPECCKTILHHGINTLHSFTPAAMQSYRPLSYVVSSRNCILTAKTNLFAFLVD
jgi:hypothetical protein